MKEAQRTTLEDLPVTNEGDGTRTKASGQRQSSRKHHTRVGESTQAVNDIVPGDSANKRISGQGKKRYGRVSDQPATKRTKRGDVDMNMHIAKFWAQTTQKVDPEERSSFKSTASSSEDAAGMSLSSKAKLDSFRDNYMRSSGDSDKLMGGPGPISLHAPQTSMNTVSPGSTNQHFQIFVSPLNCVFCKPSPINFPMLRAVLTNDYTVAATATPDHDAGCPKLSIRKLSSLLKFR